MSDGYVCSECGLDYDTIAPGDTPVAIRSFPRRIRSLLNAFDDDEDRDALVRQRPDATTWSALEYTAHLADGWELMAEQLPRHVREDHPKLSFWDPDQRAEQEGYNDGDVDATLERLAAAAEKLAEVLDGFGSGDWTRVGVYDWGERDVLAMARNMVHEGAHHRRDIANVLTKVRGRPSDDLSN